MVIYPFQLVTQIEIKRGYGPNNTGQNMNYAAIAAAMRAEIESPQRLYMPNSPGAYVRDRLFKECLWEEAAYFWGCYCSRTFNSHELNSLYLELEALAAHETMPDWGTRGT